MSFLFPNSAKKPMSLIGIVALHYVQGQNVAITSEDVSVTASGGALVSRQLPDGADVVSDLPDGITGFDDLSININNDLIFALSVVDGTVCSYSVDGENLVFVNCVTETGISVAPFSGISALSGIAVVSGGDGGTSLFPYNGVTAVLAQKALETDQTLDDALSLPDVVFLAPSTVAYSANFGEDGFGTLVASFDEFGAVTPLREILVTGSSDLNSVSPANFAFENAILPGSDGEVMYTASGVATVTDPTKDDSEVIVLEGTSGDDFQAVTVAVNPAATRAYVGGLSSDGTTSMFLEYDLADPMAPALVGDATTVNNRITSITASNNFIVVATQGVSEVQSFSVELADESSVDLTGDSSVDPDEVSVDSSGFGIKEFSLARLVLNLSFCSALLFLWV